MKSIFAHISGLDHKRTGCSFLALTLGIISVSGYNLNLSLVVCASSETLTVARQKQVLSLIFLQLKGSGIFKPVEIQKKKKKKPNYETCSQADYYADQQSLSFLSLPQMLSAICW